jgi:hypothetical protein
MLINLDFRKQSITVDGKKMHWFNGYYSDTQYMFEQHSILVSDMREFFVIDDFNYADLIMPLVYQHDYFFQKSPGSLILYNYLSILDSLNIKPKDTVQFEVDDFYDDTFMKCAYLVARKKGFKIKIIKNTSIKRTLGFAYENHFLMRSILKSRICIRYALSLLRRTFAKTDNKHADVLFLANIRFSRKKLEDNLMFGSIIKELNSRKVKNKTIFYEEIIQSKNLKNLLNNYAFQKGSYIGDYYSLNHFFRNRKDFKNLRKKWRQLRNEPLFKSKFVYKGYNYFDLIKPRFELVFNALSYLACDIRNITKKIIQKEDYKAIVIDHAENMLGKGFMLNSRLDKNKKVVALSHEQICPSCAHTCARIKKSMDRDSILWRPLPDVKCVWGDYAKNVLIKYCAYDKDIVKVTGSPKFDWIFNAHYDKKDLVKRFPFFNSKDNRKKVLILSSNMFEQYKIYLEIAQKNPECLFIFKPHPNESMALANDSLKAKSDSSKSSNIIVVDRFSDTYGLIYLSDYVMMFNTTAGFEAMLFNKIVFMINYNDIEPDGIPFKDSHAVIAIKNGTDVKNALNRLKDKNFEKHILDNVKKFVNYMHYKNDGKATIRVSDEIEKVIKEIRHK